MYIICIRMIKHGYLDIKWLWTIQWRYIIFSIPLPRLEGLVVFSISSQLRGSDLRCTPSVSMPLDSSLLIEGAKPTAPPPEVQVVQVVVAAEGNLVRRCLPAKCGKPDRDRADWTRCWVKSLSIPTQGTQNTTSVKIPFVMYVWDIYSSHTSESIERFV